jgi:hypothetical protein
MAAESADLSIPERYLGEQLIIGMMTGFLERCEGLLESLEDVDVRGPIYTWLCVWGRWSWWRHYCERVRTLA